MDETSLQLIREYVNENIDFFHTNRIQKLRQLQLYEVLKNKNPYLFKAKNVNSAAELVALILDARLSSSEEGLFGSFFEGLAIYISDVLYGGQKSSANGIDLEFTREGVRYIVAVKSGSNWGNSGQQKDLRECFKNAVKILKQSRNSLPVQPVLGICYGKVRTVDTGLFLKIVGQSFWHFISGNPTLYIDIIEPIGYEAKNHNDAFLKEKDATYNRFSRDFTIEFCDEMGNINWAKLVEFNSGNLKPKA